MGQDLSRPGYDACRHRSPRPSRNDSGDECRELSPPRGPRSKARSRQAANPRDNQQNREGRWLIDVPRQSKPCQDIGQRQLSFRSPPRLTQIDAPFSARLSRDTYADDLVILCRKGNAEEALHRLREIMGKLKLTVNEEK